MHGIAKASGVRRCVRRGLGAVSARCRRRAAWHAGHSFSLKCLFAQLHWGKQGMNAFCNVMLVERPLNS